ncbi:MAG: hypothetical protein KBC98_01420 [Candidatus Pacebacteria bacterium]|jgi:hypothetical protein|nr:hypothetical protein [Candidatus Paceibacterota bacterium]
MKKELVIPFCLYVAFFVFQVLVQPSELVLTGAIVLLTVFTFLIHRNKGEFALLTVGLITGFVIEVGLGLIARQQNWENASLWGVPFWLPLVWGLGFVVITRLGFYIRKPRH